MKENWPLAHCRSCGKPIYWTITAKGKRSPVDATPVPEGTLFVERDLATGELHSRVERGNSSSNRYVSHFATCPNAKHHRKENR